MKAPGSPGAFPALQTIGERMYPYSYSEHLLPSFDGTRLYCREAGDRNAPLLLLIHGAGTDADFYKDAAEVFSQWFHVVAYDRRGHVRSQLLPEKKLEQGMDQAHALLSPSQILNTHAEDAYALLQAFCPEGKAYVLGHSYGGAVALTLAQRHPDCFSQMLVYEPARPYPQGEASEKLRILRESRARFLRGDYPAAFSVLGQVTGNPDTRGRAPTREELDNILPDSRMFYHYDLPPQLKGFYRPDFSALAKLPIQIAIGEGNRGTSIYEDTLAMAQALGKEPLYFPSVHNCAFHLPREFAFLATGALLSKKRYFFD